MGEDVQDNFEKIKSWNFRFPQQELINNDNVTKNNGKEGIKQKVESRKEKDKTKEPVTF